MDYYDPKKGLSSAYKMYKRGGIKYEALRKLLNKEEPYQLNKQDHSVVYFPITGRGKYSYQADLMFVDDAPILCIINVNTRVAYAYVMKEKTASQTYDKFEEWIDNIKVPIKYIQTDRGSEFNNVIVKELFEKNKIEHNMVNVDDHAGQGKIERFNQTLRRLITLYESATKKGLEKSVG